MTPLDAADRPAEPVETWEDLARLQIVLSNPADTSPEARYGTALRYIAIQPRTDTNISEARRLLTELSGQSESRDIAAAASYQLVRLVQWRTAHPDLLQLAQDYREVYRRWPETYHGQLSLVRAVPLVGYLTEDVTVAQEKLEELAGLSGGLTDRGIRRNLLAALAEVYHRRSLSAARAQQLTEQALALGFDHRPIATNLRVAAATRAARAGDWDAAKTHARRFLSDYPEDVRAFEVRQLLAQWEAHTP